jgi:hypothetical protein
MHWARANSENVVTTATRLADAMIKVIRHQSGLAGKVGIIESRLSALEQHPTTLTLPGN